MSSILCLDILYYILMLFGGTFTQSAPSSVQLGVSGHDERGDESQKFESTEKSYAGPRPCTRRCRAILWRDHVRKKMRTRRCMDRDNVWWRVLLARSCFQNVYIAYRFLP